MLNKLIIAKQLKTKEVKIQMFKTHDFRCLGKEGFGGHMTSDWLAIAQASYNRNVPTESEGVGG